MGTYFQNVALVMGHNSEFSKAHIYPTPYRSYPPSASVNFLISQKYTDYASNRVPKSILDNVLQTQKMSDPPPVTY